MVYQYSYFSYYSCFSVGVTAPIGVQPDNALSSCGEPACVSRTGFREDDFDKASRISEEAGEEHVHEDPWASSIFLSCLVGLRVVQGRHAEANALGARCIALCQEIEDPVRTAWCLDAIAVAQAAQGGPLRSARLWGASDQLLDSAAALLPPTHRWIRDRHFDGVKEALGDAASQTALSEGRSMSLRQAIRYALEVGPS
jgi:hypothetical protein